MEIINRKNDASTVSEQLTRSNVSRRNFFRFGGIVGASVMMAGSMTGCDKDDENGINLGSGDTGVLNYAYALEQLEAAFYTQVIASQFSGITAMETSYLTDIRDHEIAHREFLKAALQGSAIPALVVNFSSVDFGNRASVLATAKAFEDLGVSAYNGAGKLLTDGDNLVIAGKIVSVEARHAALIRELISPNSFAAADIVDGSGLDLARRPSEVLTIASAYLRSKLNASGLPTS